MGHDFYTNSFKYRVICISCNYILLKYYYAQIKIMNTVLNIKAVENYYRYTVDSQFSLKLF